MKNEDFSMTFDIFDEENDTIIAEMFLPRVPILIK